MKKRTHASSRLFCNFFVISLLFVTPFLILALIPPAVHSAEVLLAWNSVAESDGYNVYYGSSSGVYQAAEDGGNQTSHTLFLDPGEYYFAVTAYNNYGESGYSEEVSCTVQATNPVTYVVVASAGENGSISPSGQVTVEHGTDKTFNITPGTDYHIEDVLVDGISVGAVTSYIFSSVTQDHTIAANFAVDTWSISASAGENGSISPSGNVTVSQGSNQTFTITPNQGCHVVDVQVDGLSVGAVTSYTFTDVTQDHAITASFDIDSYFITSSSEEHGTISPSGVVAVAHGSEQTFTIIPDQNYHIADLIVDGVSIGAQNSHTFSNVTQDHTISATFSIDTHVIHASAGDHGSINPAGSVTVNHGADQTFLISSDENYRVADVVVDGMSVGAVTSYTFYDVKGDHAIFSSFIRINQAPVADAGPDQSVDEGVSVTLSGANSSDPDPDDVITYSWEQIGGQTVSLLDPNAAITTFGAPSVCPDGDALIFQLTVTDIGGLASNDTCIINVSSTNIQPTAEAGPNQEVNEGETVTLDGSGSADPDGNIISYMWEQVAGPHADLSDPMVARPAFTAPDVGVDGVSLTFQLTVEDDGGLKSTDTCIVNISWVNTPPVADAGLDQNAAEGSSVTLDGANSVDSDDGITSYRWIQTDGNPVTLSDPTAVNPTFTIPNLEQVGGSFIFQLIVRDNGGLEDSDTCTVYATSATIHTPIPDIKANGQDGTITVSYGNPVQITVNLDPGDYVGQKADWWISVLSPDNSWNSYAWKRNKWVSGIKRSSTENIMESFREVLNTKGLTPGGYTFYFAVDDNIDNKTDSTWLDSVKVLVE